MAKFKCNQTGNVYDFELEYDIEQMREHPDYSEVIEETKSVEAKKQKLVKE